MKDNRFIELVNLYIDRQITAEETAELEAEMQDNPRRRAIYRQYCQLHTATKQVYESFRSNAAEGQAAPAAGRVVRADFARRPRSNWIHYAGGLAAAACLTLVFVRYNAGSPAGADSPAQATLAPAAEVAVAAAPVPAAVESVALTASATPAALRADLTVEPDYAALVAAMRQAEQRAFATGEIQPSRLPSLFDDGVFETRSVLPANNQRVFRGKQAPAQQAEFTAFQFQR